MARLTQLVVDSRTPASLARFWATALDDFEIRPYDDAEIARLAETGRTPETDPSVILDGPTFEICFQEVAALAGVKRAVPLDISTSERPLEQDRLVSLGASIVQEFDRHTWMRDPRATTSASPTDTRRSLAPALLGIGEQNATGVKRLRRSLSVAQTVESAASAH